MRKPANYWNDKLPELEKLRLEGKSYGECGAILGMPRGTVAGLCSKHGWQTNQTKAPVSGNGVNRNPRKRDKTLYGGWTEAMLTEKWSDYSARKKAERKAKALAEAKASNTFAR